MHINTHVGFPVLLANIGLLQINQNWRLCSSVHAIINQPKNYEGNRNDANLHMQIFFSYCKKVQKQTVKNITLMGYFFENVT